MYSREKSHFINRIRYLCLFKRTQNMSMLPSYMGWVGAIEDRWCSGKYFRKGDPFSVSPFPFFSRYQMYIHHICLLVIVFIMETDSFTFKQPSQILNIRKQQIVDYIIYYSYVSTVKELWHFLPQVTK